MPIELAFKIIELYWGPFYYRSREVNNFLNKIILLSSSLAYIPQESIQMQVNQEYTILEFFKSKYFSCIGFL